MIVLVALELGAVLWAPRARAESPVLHEFVSGIEPDEALLTLGVEDGEGQSLLAQDDVLGAFEEEGVMVATPGDGEGAELPGQRSPSFRPDRQTQLEGRLGYQEAFDPSIAPFKRVTSLDATELDSDGVTPVLAIRDPQRRKLRALGERAAAPDSRPRDRFRGRVQLDFSQGRVLPLPSVSPESRILSLHTEPSTGLAIERDGADNFYAVATGPLPQVEVSLSFLTDAPRSYFGGELPAVRVDALAAEVPPLDPGIRARALRFAAELGILPSSDLPAAVAALTAHFRSFEESDEPPRDSGDIYLDLARAKKGICRHRAYGFVVTAHALGIPARFVQNEAHSWVEIAVPRIGFRRIDLGGAADGLTTRGLGNRAAYQPAEPDRLPRPAAYERSYSLARRNASESRARDARALQGRSMLADLETDAPADSVFTLGPNAGLARDDSGREAVSIALDQRSASVLRGGPLRLSGRVQAASGEGVAGLRIEVSLAAENRRERMLLGVTVSGAGGGFARAFDIPLDLPVGEYRLLVVTPGNERLLPAIAE